MRLVSEPPATCNSALVCYLNVYTTRGRNNGDAPALSVDRLGRAQPHCHADLFT